MNAIVPAALVPTDMDQAIRLAKAMSDAKMLPKHLQGDVGTCLMIVEQAMRWGMSPFAVAQCTSSIGGKLMFEGKLVAAAVEASGVIEGHFDYAFAGEGDDRQVTISARRRGDANPRQLTIKLRDVRTTNEHWKRQPDQMLAYSSARNWARRFTPAVLLGVYAPEEFSREGKPVDDFTGPTIEAEPDERDVLNASVPLTKPVPLNKAAAAGMQRGDRIIEKARVYDTGPSDPLMEKDPRKWMANVQMALANAQSQAEVEAIATHQSIEEATAQAPGEIKARLSKLLVDAFGRFVVGETELPEGEIIGERHLGAG